MSLFLVERDAPGVSMNAYRTVDSLRAADVRFAGVQRRRRRAAGRARAAALPLIEEAVDFATALLCAEAVGAMKFANDTTLEYLKTRKQFGVPIGSFQALQHRMVDMYVSAEQARSMAILAAPVDAGGRSRRAPAGRVGGQGQDRRRGAPGGQEAIQLHGGMGMTEEMKVSHKFRRLTMIAQHFGDADHHLDRFASLDR